ncbi:MAG: PAS domain-containing protein [Planctomycetota bacterium]
MLEAENRSLIESLQLRLLESTPDLLAIASKEGRFLWVSAAWTEALGWSAEELMASPFLDFVVESDREATMAEFAEMIREGRSALQFQNRYRQRDGGCRWLEWNANVVDDGHVLCVARDITDRKETEQRASERLRQLQMTEELVALGSWRVDIEEGLPYWSPMVYQIHGRDPETYRPSLEEAIDAYHVEDRQRVADYVGGAIERREPFDFEARIVRPCGEVRLVHSRGVPEVDDDGEVVSLFGIFRDITDERRIEETVRRSERMASIGTMAAGIAHEINNPLSYVLGNLQLLQEDLCELQRTVGDQVLSGMREMLEDSVAGAQRIRKIVDGVRSFTRVEAARAGPVDVNEAVHAAVAFAEHEIKVRAVLSLELAARNLVLIDETQLVQVLVNLLINAAQALPAGSASEHRIRIATEDDGDCVSLCVSDTGPGVPAELHGRIFDPFFTTKPVGNGTGLGLSICHTIVEQCGGSIALEPSEAGACFRVRLPVAERTVDRDDDAVDVPDGGGGLPTLLVVDDEPAVLKMVSRALRRQFVVQQARSGREAIERLGSGLVVDLILCDLMMPEVSGMDVLQHLREQHQELVPRFVFATGGNFAPEARAQLEQEGVELVRKPIDVANLRERLESLLGALGRRPA